MYDVLTQFFRHNSFSAYSQVTLLQWYRKVEQQISCMHKLMYARDFMHAQIDIPIRLLIMMKNHMAQIDSNLRRQWIHQIAVQSGHVCECRLLRGIRKRRNHGSHECLIKDRIHRYTRRMAYHLEVSVATKRYLVYRRGGVRCTFKLVEGIHSA